MRERASDDGCMAVYRGYQNVKSIYAGDVLNELKTFLGTLTTSLVNVEQRGRHPTR